MKYICLVLALTIIFTSVNWDVFITKADEPVVETIEENDEPETDEQDIFENEEIDRSLVPIDYEIVEKRTENEKHFRKIDGTYEVAIYNQAVHYLNNGKWEDIDNSLVQNKDELETKANKFKLKFPKELDGSKQIKLKMADYSIE